MHESCGVVGVYAPGQDAARIAFFGIFALQHRGQESAGVAVTDGNRLRVHTGMGLVTQAFHGVDSTRLPGHMAIAHTRYSTTGSNNSLNAQPLQAEGPNGELALGHNGNVVNAKELRQYLLEAGCQFKGSTDSEVITQLLAFAPGRTWEERVGYLMRTVQGAYSLVVLTKDSLVGIHDPLGVRPLCLGRLEDGWVIASESCALDQVGATYDREIEPGETIVINDQGVRSFFWAGERGWAPCIFEHIYFARPDSVLNGRLVYSNRVSMGAQLAREHPADADIVIGVPDSATAAAVGYARELGISYSEGLIKNRYVGRTFIEPDQDSRDLGVRLKFNPLPEVILGKRVVVVDDSIVRGTTTPHIVRLLRKAGAKEVHLRVCAPPLRYPCYFGVDIPSRNELIGAGRTVEEINQKIGADSLGYLSLDGLAKAAGSVPDRHCTACFSGHYPIPIQLELSKFSLESE